MSRNPGSKLYREALLKEINKELLVKKIKYQHYDKMYRKFGQIRKYFRTPEGFPLEYHGHMFIAEIYDDPNPRKCVMKSTQCGITIYVVASIMEWMKRGRGQDTVMLVLPTGDTRQRYVKEKIDRIIANVSQYSSKLGIDSVSLKSMGNSLLNIAISNSSSSMASYTAKYIVVEEVDECNQENIVKLPERQSHVLDPHYYNVGNPTVDEVGIHYEFLKSDQRYWNIRCSSCGKIIIPDFFKHVVRQVGENEYEVRDPDYDPTDLLQEVRPICHHCERPYDRLAMGKFIPTARSLVSGYHISKMFSSFVGTRYLVDKFFEGLANETIMQRFYNGDLGMPYVGKGAQLTDALIRSCIGEYRMPDSCYEPCVAGIDVGNVLNIVICQVVTTIAGLQLKLVFAGTITCPEGNLTELMELFTRYNIKAACMDMRPEKRLTQKVISAYKAVWGCDYLHEAMSDRIKKQFKVIQVDRTSTLDDVKSSFITKRIVLPSNIETVPGFFEQLKAPRRFWHVPNSKSVGYFKWDEGNKADHYYHAMGYMQTAVKMLAKMMR